MLRLVKSPVQETSLKADRGYDALRGIMERYSARTIPWAEVTRVAVLGLDAIAFNTGPRDFGAISTGRMETAPGIWGVWPDRQQATVKALLRGISPRVRHRSHFVGTDREAGFVHAATEVVGKRVKRVMERCHVAQRYRRGVERGRKHELQRFKQALSEKA